MRSFLKKMKSYKSFRIFLTFTVVFLAFSLMGANFCQNDLTIVTNKENAVATVFVVPSFINSLPIDELPLPISVEDLLAVLPLDGFSGGPYTFPGTQ